MTELLTHKVVEVWSILCEIEKFQFLPHLAAILDFCEKTKTVNILETIRDRVISTEFLSRRE